LQKIWAATRTCLRKLDQSLTPWPVRWHTLQTISNNPAARAVIIVPLIGYWILLNNWIVQHFTPLSEALVDKMRQTPWQLFATYFGLWLVGVGSATYLIRCPPDIKRHATSSEYTGALFPTISEIEFSRIRDALIAGDAQSNREIQELEREHIRRGQETDTEYDTRWRRERWSNVLKLYHDYCNRSRAIARLTISVLYIVGFLALGAPSLNLFWRVASMALRTGFGAHPLSP
jgi:hypothetical protein